SAAAGAPGAALAVEFVADADGVSYIVRLQPELLRAVAWTATAEAGPSLATFPVQGRSARSVQSFWGADRDGGARAHQGIDIFAPRGTPALAATDGVVRHVGENRLGGRVVFLYDPAGGQSLYYAHLDAQAVTGGQRVRAGDTLGFVGNTGNARTTSPHLHFGIYRGGEGAVNPFPYVDDQQPRAPALAARDSAAAGRRGRAASAAPLRSGPSERAATVARVAAATSLAVEGVSAVAGGAAWLRVRLPDGTAGYLPAALVRAAAAPGD
ncbi:MAG TPA: M23 family metallopeptidase, partial [Gemmatirosa sp.]|nr:M23 family metallopeptidase [Gemmatirosa sp.]